MFECDLFFFFFSIYELESMAWQRQHTDPSLLLVIENCLVFFKSICDVYMFSFKKIDQ